MPKNNECSTGRHANHQQSTTHRRRTKWSSSLRSIWEQKTKMQSQRQDGRAELDKDGRPRQERRPRYAVDQALSWSRTGKKRFGSMESTPLKRRSWECEASAYECNYSRSVDRQCVRPSLGGALKLGTGTWLVRIKVHDRQCCSDERQRRQNHATGRWLAARSERSCQAAEQRLDTLTIGYRKLTKLTLMLPSCTSDLWTLVISVGELTDRGNIIAINNDRESCDG